MCDLRRINIVPLPHPKASGTRRSHRIFDVLNGKILRICHELVRHKAGARSDRVGVCYLYTRSCPEHHCKRHDRDYSSKTDIPSHLSLQCTHWADCAWSEGYLSLGKAFVTQFTDMMNSCLAIDMNQTAAQPTVLRSDCIKLLFSMEGSYSDRTINTPVRGSESANTDAS
jgi:hypothetical protein